MFIPHTNRVEIGWSPVYCGHIRSPPLHRRIVWNVEGQVQVLILPIRIVKCYVEGSSFVHNRIKVRCSINDGWFVGCRWINVRSEYTE